MLIRLLYFSEVCESLSISDIKSIVEMATEFNKTVGITGCLYFDEQFFIQVLEGDRFKVSQLYNKIAKDNRHKNIVIVDVAPIAKRDFAQWSVLYLGKIRPKNETLLKYSPVNEFNPNYMTTENLLEFVLELKNDVLKN